MIAWGKLSADRTRSHSLVAHSADVAAVMERLLASPVVSARLARLAGVDALDPVTVARLVVLAAVHDMGKANRGFFLRASPEPQGLRAGHIKPVVDLLARGAWTSAARWVPSTTQRRLIDPLRLDRLALWTGGFAGLLPVLDAVLAHHGRLPLPGNPDRRLWEAADGYDPVVELARLGDTLEIWCPAAFEAEPLRLTVTPRFLHAFAGLLMLADWMGSDALFFAFDPGPDPHRIDHARIAAAQAAGRTGIGTDAARDRIGTVADVSSPILGAGRKPRPIQTAIGSVALPPAGWRDGSIVAMESETGSGKTEAAIIHFARLFRTGAVDGLYLALPTRSAAVQIHGRVVACLEALLGADAPPVVLAVPGYIRVDDADGVRLPEYAVQWPDDRTDTLRDRGWTAEHPKRFLAAAVAVGTIDQLLLGGLDVRHAQLRSSPMLRQLLVIDEVHASDVYMEAILRHLLDQHVRAGGHALLMSATLGTAARARFVGDADAGDWPSLDVRAALPYPAIHGAGIHPTACRIAGGPVKRVAVELLEDDDPDHALALRAVAAAGAGARVLVIRNRVDDARRTAEVVAALSADAPGHVFRCKEVATVHHGRFAPADRRLLDAALESALGAGSRAPVICVTTQTAEQSLDIDADLLLTDLCPADVLLQRIGRLHRHDRPTRPANFATARIVVNAPSEARLDDLLTEKGQVRGRLLGLGKVYPDLLGLVATRRTLVELGVLDLPRHNRLLVECATDRSDLYELAAGLGPKWRAHWQEIEGIRGAARVHARFGMLAFDQPLRPSDDRDLGAAIRTRLGLDSRSAVLADAPLGPFGERVSEVNIPGWMAGGIPANAEPVSLAAIGGGFSFTLGERRYLYDRWGLSVETSRWLR